MGTTARVRRTSDLPKAGRRGFLLVTIAAVLLIASVLTVGCAGKAAEAPAEEAVPEATTQIIEDITVPAASDLIEKNRGNADFAIIDVRTPDEFNGGHIEGAEMIDFRAEDFNDRMGKLDRDKTYLVYCRSGGRSAGARDVMKELGFREVYNMLGGISGWTDEGLPVVQ